MLVAAPLVAQNDAQSRRAAIDAIYPVMIRALEEKNFGRARNICDQAILWEPQNPVHHYNLACIEAQAGRLPQAWGALDLAIALGFNDANHLQTDPDLAPLRGESRFADLVRKVMFNVSAGDAIAGLKIPSSPPAASSGESSAAGDEPELPPPATFDRGVPVGLFFLSRYRSTAQPAEKAAWYFAPDGTVYQNLEHGFSRADLASHAGARGKASLADRTLEITWADGTRTRAPIERDGDSFTWDMGIFAPITAFESSGDAAGVYESSDMIAGGADPLAVAQRLELRADGTFTSEGISFSPTRKKTDGVPASTPVTGRWEVSGVSLILRTADGATLRRIAFPDDDPKTVVKPDRMFFAGLMYKRRP